MPWRRMPCRSSKLDALSFTSPAACRPNCWQRKNMKNKVLLKPKFHPVEKCFSCMVFIVFALVGWKTRRDLCRQDKSKAKSGLRLWFVLTAWKLWKSSSRKSVFDVFFKRDNRQKHKKHFRAVGFTSLGRDEPKPRLEQSSALPPSHPDQPFGFRSPKAKTNKNHRFS